MKLVIISRLAAVFFLSVLFLSLLLFLPSGDCSAASVSSVSVVVTGTVTSTLSTGELYDNLVAAFSEPLSRTEEFLTGAAGWFVSLTGSSDGASFAASFSSSISNIRGWVSVFSEFFGDYLSFGFVFSVWLLFRALGTFSWLLRFIRWFVKWW